MPVRSAPEPGEAPFTKRISPEELDPAREWLEIVDYLDVGVLRASRQAGIKTITQANKSTREEQDDDAYLLALFTAQVKAWRLEADPREVPADQKRPSEQRKFEQVDGVWVWRFAPLNFPRLPTDLRNWLHVEILNCGGVIPTASVVVTTDSGQVLDFRGPDGLLGAAAEPQIPDRQRDALVPEAQHGAGKRRN